MGEGEGGAGMSLLHTWTQRGGSSRWERCKCSGLRPWAAPLMPTLEPKETWPLLEKKPPCPRGRARTPASGCHSLDQPGGCRSHLDPCLASYQDENPTLSISSGTNVKVQVWRTAVASVCFLCGLRRALCLPAPLFLKLSTRLAHQLLQIPLPPSILPSCNLAFFPGRCTAT